MELILCGTERLLNRKIRIVTNIGRPNIYMLRRLSEPKQQEVLFLSTSFVKLQKEIKKQIPANYLNRKSA